LLLPLRNTTLPPPPPLLLLLNRGQKPSETSQRPVVGFAV
jgi:hypothetical protein